MKKEQEVILTARIPSDVMEAVRRLARQDDRSVNGEIVHALRELVKRELVERESSDTMEQKKEPVAV